MWFKYKAPWTGTMVFETSERSEFDTVMAVYKGESLAGLQVVVENDDSDSGANGSSKVVFKQAVDEIYHVCVDGYDPSQYGLFELWFADGPDGQGLGFEWE